ncbi:MAG TPA: hypothetical protein VFM27_04090, partial [Acidimicrobiales bacterium]|nr:hypothetical protein [Acidimicrobiales bacterium]
MASTTTPPASPSPPPTVELRHSTGGGGAAGAALAGLVSAALALGAGELVAGTGPRLASPVEAVAREVIDRAPRPVERFAVETFGIADKLALVVGTLALSAVLGAVLGLVARRRPWAGALGLAAFAVLGAAASLSAPSAPAVAAVPSLAGGAAGAGALWLLLGRAGRARRVSPSPGPAGVPSPRPSGGAGSRRAFLGLAAGMAAAAALAGAGGRALRSRFSAAESRAGVTLPPAARPLPAVPAAAEVGVRGVAPFVTPNADFYRIDTALVVPQVRAEDWSLRVTGIV